MRKFIVCDYKFGDRHFSRRFAATALHGSRTRNMAIKCRKAERRKIVTAHGNRVGSNRPEAENQRQRHPVHPVSAGGTHAYSRVQYYNVWAWDALANQLDHSGVSKGDMLRVKGYLELASYVKSDGVTRDKMLKLRLTEWSTAVKTTAGTAKENGPYPDGNDHGKTAVINGDRENLPG